MAEITTEQCMEILKKSVNKPLEILEHSMQKYSEETIGFLGEHFKLSIKTKSEQNYITLHQYFVKTIPESTEIFKEYVKEMGFFEKECEFYKKIIPKIFERKNNEISPKCLLVSDNFIVLEDLQLQGYQIYKKCFDYEQWHPLLKAMAKLHANCIVYEEKLSTNDVKYRLNNEFESTLKESTFIFDVNHPRGKWLRNCLRSVIDLLQIYTGCNERIEVANRILKFTFNRLPDLIKPSEKYRNCISHADLWKNNVLFKTDICGHIDAVLIDFQLIRYAPPILDVLTAIYLNSERGFLEDNFYAVLNVYYSYFCTFLKMESVDPNSILPHDEFLACVEEYKMVAILEATFFGLIVYISDKLAKDINTNEETFKDFTYDNKTQYIIKEYDSDYVFKYKMDTMLQRLVDITLNKHDI